MESFPEFLGVQFHFRIILNVAFSGRIQPAKDPGHESLMRKENVARRQGHSSPHRARIASGGMTRQLGDQRRRRSQTQGARVMVMRMMRMRMMTGSHDRKMIRLMSGGGQDRTDAVVGGASVQKRMKSGHLGSSTEPQLFLTEIYLSVTPASRSSALVGEASRFALCECIGSKEAYRKKSPRWGPTVEGRVAAAAEAAASALPPDGVDCSALPSSSSSNRFRQFV